MTTLSVNVNKIAWLRNSRAGDRPDVLAAARTAIAAGAHGITVHPRPDQRHIRPADVAGPREPARPTSTRTSSSTSRGIPPPGGATTAIPGSTA